MHYAENWMHRNPFHPLHNPMRWVLFVTSLWSDKEP